MITTLNEIRAKFTLFIGRNDEPEQDASITGELVERRVIYHSRVWSWAAPFGSLWCTDLDNPKAPDERHLRTLPKKPLSLWIFRLGFIVIRLGDEFITTMARSSRVRRYQRRRYFETVRISWTVLSKRKQNTVKKDSINCIDHRITPFRGWISVNRHHWRHSSLLFLLQAAPRRTSRCAGALRPSY